MAEGDEARGGGRSFVPALGQENRGKMHKISTVNRYRARHAFRIAATLAVFTGCRSSMVEPGNGVPASISVAPAGRTVLVGDTLTLLAVARDARGELLANQRFVWHSADTAVARVDSMGHVYATGAGTARIEAATGSLRGDAVLEVHAPADGWRDATPGCGVWTDNSLQCWTWSGLGGPISRPAVVARGMAFTLVRVGEYHRCALAVDHRAFCWGNNDFGQLGDGSTTTRSEPVPVAGGLLFDSLTVGALHTCGLTNGGEAYCWGAGATGQLGSGIPLQQCSGGLPCSPVPVRIPELVFRSLAAGGLDRPAPLAHGNGFTCGLDVSGVAYCWGTNVFGQLGDGSRTDRSVPAPVAGGRRYVAIAAGSMHACAVDADGEGYCWGSSSDGQLGLQLPPFPEGRCPVGDIAWGCSLTPARVETAQRLRAISASRFNTCALAWFGEALCWGDYTFGQLGESRIPTAADHWTATPTMVESGESYVAVRAGASAVCAVTPRRSALCWGNGSPGATTVPTP